MVGRAFRVFLGAVLVLLGRETVGMPITRHNKDVIPRSLFDEEQPELYARAVVKTLPQTNKVRDRERLKYEEAERIVNDPNVDETSKKYKDAEAIITAQDEKKKVKATGEKNRRSEERSRCQEAERIVNGPNVNKTSKKYKDAEAIISARDEKKERKAQGQKDRIQSRRARTRLLTSTPLHRPATGDNPHYSHRELTVIPVFTRPSSPRHGIPHAYGHASHVDNPIYGEAASFVPLPPNLPVIPVNQHWHGQHLGLTQSPPSNPYAYGHASHPTGSNLPTYEHTGHGHYNLPVDHPSQGQPTQSNYQLSYPPDEYTLRQL